MGVHSCARVGVRGRDRVGARLWCGRAFACVHLRFPPYGASMDGWAHSRQRAMAPHPEAGLSAHKLVHLALDQPVRINQPTAAHATRSSPALLKPRSAALSSPPLSSPLLSCRCARFVPCVPQRLTDLQCVSWSEYCTRTTGDARDPAGPAAAPHSDMTRWHTCSSPCAACEICS